MRWGNTFLFRSFRNSLISVSLTWLLELTQCPSSVLAYFVTSGIADKRGHCQEQHAQTVIVLLIKPLLFPFPPKFGRPGPPMPPLRTPLVTIFYYVLHAEGKKEEHHIWWWLNVAIQSTRGHTQHNSKNKKKGISAFHPWLLCST